MRATNEIIRKLNIIWNEFVYGGHLLSLGLVSVAYSGSLVLDVRVSWDFLLIVYLGTESIYLYNRYREFKIDFQSNPERTRHLEKYVKKIPFIIFLFSLVIFIIFIINKNFLALTFVIFLILMSFFYSKFFKKFTKTIIGFKSFFVAIMASLLVLFLAIYYSVPFTFAFFLFSIFVFLKCFINTSFFDIKDIEVDKKENLKTLALVLGEEKLIQLLRATSTLTIVPLIVGVCLKALPSFSLILFLTIPYMFFYLKQLRCKKINLSFLYNVIVDGEFILWPVLLIVGRMIIL